MHTNSLRSAQIDLTRRGFDGDYMKAFAETLKGGLRPGVHQISLRFNRVSSEAATHIFSSLVFGHCQLEVLDISQNLVGLNAMGSLNNFLKMSILMELDLSNQNGVFKGHACQTLCEGIKHQATLSKLNISKNAIGTVGTQSLASLIGTKKCTLKELGMAWTDLNGFQGSAFFTSLETNKSLKVLDISYNSLGGGVGGEGAVFSLSKGKRASRT